MNPILITIEIVTTTLDTIAKTLFERTPSLDGDPDEGRGTGRELPE
jgi:hypothetical protein